MINLNPLLILFLYFSFLGNTSVILQSQKKTNMSDKKELVFEANGFQIKTNSLYKIVGKPDANAPSGFVTEGVTKLPSDGVGNSVPCRFHITNTQTGTGVWDTGLHEASPCYHDKDVEEVKNIVKRLRTHIVNPYKRVNGKSRDLDHNDDEFWLNYSVNLFEKRVFNTSKVDDLLDLFIAVNNYSLCPKGKEGDPRYSDADYCIVDIEKATDYKKQKASDKMNAVKNFAKMEAKNRMLLINILAYNNLKVSTSIDEETLNFTFQEWLEKDSQNSTVFNESIERVGSEPKFEEKVNLYTKLNTLYKAERGVTRKSNGKYYYNDIELGGDLKNAAETLLIDTELSEIKQEIIAI